VIKSIAAAANRWMPVWFTVSWPRILAGLHDGTHDAVAARSRETVCGL